MTIPLVIHVPHASTVIPPDALGDFCVPLDVLRSHAASMTDHFADRLFTVEGTCVTTVTFPISRLVVDPERFEDDAQEPMAARGQGVLYERGADGSMIRPRLSHERRATLLSRWYRPHHDRLAAAVNDGLGTLTVGVLPGHDPGDANEFVDIVIASGLDHVRNSIVAHADAVVAIGGGAGTMSELCFAWINKRLIVAMRVDGWSGRMADQRIDDRVRYPNEPDDRVFGADTATDVTRLLAERLARFSRNHHGVRRRE